MAEGRSAIRTRVAKQSRTGVLRNEPKIRPCTRLPMYHALIGGEHRFGFGSRQIADRDLLTDVERAQVLFPRLGADLCHGSSPEEGTPHAEGRFLGRLSDAHPSHGVEVAAVARQLSEVRIKHNRRG